MGKLVEFKCSCGHSKTLQLGGGMFSARIDRIAACFTEEQMQPYWRAKEDGTLAGLTVENEPALCGGCNDLIEIPVMTLETSNDENRSFTAPCFQCHQTPKVLPRESVACPICGRPMKSKDVGFWD